MCGFCPFCRAGDSAQKGSQKEKGSKRKRRKGTGATTDTGKGGGYHVD